MSLGNIDADDDRLSSDFSYLERDGIYIPKAQQAPATGKNVLLSESNNEPQPLHLHM